MHYALLKKTSVALVCILYNCSSKHRNFKFCVFILKKENSEKQGEERVVGANKYMHIGPPLLGQVAFLKICKERRVL